MSVVFLVIGIKQIIEGEHNTGRGRYVRIITPSEYPIEFYFWVAFLFAASIGSLYLGIFAYRKNKGNDQH